MGEDTTVAVDLPKRGFEIAISNPSRQPAPEGDRDVASVSVAPCRPTRGVSRQAVRPPRRVRATDPRVRIPREVVDTAAASPSSRAQCRATSGRARKRTVRSPCGKPSRIGSETRGVSLPPGAPRPEARASLDDACQACDPAPQARETAAAPTPARPRRTDWDTQSRLRRSRFSTRLRNGEVSRLPPRRPSGGQSDLRGRGSPYPC